MNVLPVVDLGSDITQYNSEQRVLDAGFSYATFIWEKNGTSDGTNRTYTVDGALWNLGTNTLKLIVEDNAGCAGSDEITVFIADSDISKLVNGAVLYPNPSVDYFRFKFESAIIRPAIITIVSSIGKVILRESFTAEQMSILEIPIYGLTSGVYYVTLSIDGNQVTKSFVKE